MSSVEEEIGRARRQAAREIVAVRAANPGVDLIAGILVTREQVQVAFMDREEQARIWDKRPGDEVAQREGRDLAAYLRTPPAGSPMTALIVDEIDQHITVVHDPPADPDFSAWLSGFTDSRGDFILEMARVGDKEIPTVRFQVTVKPDAEHFLEKIRSYLGVGYIFRSTMGGHDGRGRKIKPMVRYCVEDIDELHDVIVPHFDAYPPMTPLLVERFAIWRQGVEFFYRVINGAVED
jgi:hypothetical protein